MSLYTNPNGPLPKSGSVDDDRDIEDDEDDDDFFFKKKKKTKTKKPKGNLAHPYKEEKEKEKEKEKEEEEEEKEKEVIVLLGNDDSDSRPEISFNSIIVSRTIMGCYVKVQDLRTLGPDQWLNDVVINYSMMLLQEADTAALVVSEDSNNDSNLRKPSIYLHSYFMENLVSNNFVFALKYIHFNNMYDADRIYVPIHRPNHWAIAVMYVDLNYIYIYIYIYTCIYTCIYIRLYI